MELEFIDDGVEATSTLKCRQIHYFFERMKTTIWKVTVERSTMEDVQENKFYTGVCITNDGLILTRLFSVDHISKIHVVGPGEQRYYEARLVHHDGSRGLALLRATTRLESYDHVKFAQQTSFHAGQSLYAIIHQNVAFSPIFLKGQLAYQYDPNSRLTNEYCPVYRTVADLPVDACPCGLDKDVSLLQIAGLGPRVGFQGRKECNYINQFGLEEACGGPIFNATGHLAGLSIFQYGGFDFAIPTSELKDFFSGYAPSHDDGLSKQYGQREDKGKRSQYS